MFPLSVSGRKLLTTSGKPFFMNGDTAWSGLVQNTLAEWQTYLNDRVNHGFNTLLVNLIESTFSDNPPNNAYAEGPFSTPGDFTTPNDNYFNRVKLFLDECLSRDIYLVLCPCYYGYNGGSEGWWPQVTGESVATMENYGEYLGTKFAAYPNIMWAMGGDWNGTADAIDKVDAMVTGLKATGRADWLFTYHAAPTYSAADVVNGKSWLDVNNTYNKTMADLPSNLYDDYTRATTRPFFLIESRYDGGSTLNNATALQLRQQAYWSVLYGAIGAIYGNNPIWHFDSSAGYSHEAYSWTYAEALASSSADERTIFKNLFDTYNWYDFTPDNSNTILTAGHGTGESLALCASSSNAALIYTSIQKTLTFDASQFGVKVIHSRYFNPSTGEWTVWRQFAPDSGRTISQPSSRDWLIELRAR